MAGPVDVRPTNNCRARSVPPPETLIVRKPWEAPFSEYLIPKAADSAPPLLVFESEVRLLGVDGERTLELVAFIEEGHPEGEADILEQRVHVAVAAGVAGGLVVDRG